MTYKTIFVCKEYKYELCVQSPFFDLEFNN